MLSTTIISVNFNTPKFIELCIKSIILNTSNYQLVIVDNGSVDSSLDLLKKYQQAGKITLVRRKVGYNSSEHGRAIDQVLNSGLIKSPLVCTIDSDAYAAKKGWLVEIDKQRKGNFAAGYAHFRDPHWLHPACMLFDYIKYKKIGSPSFALTTTGGFLDTGVLVSMEALKHGEKLVVVKGIDKLVPHRWRGTRIQKVSGDRKLDGNITKAEFYAENEKWLSRPDIRQIMKCSVVT